jgi:16S rRNA (cytosine1402-N4)-methyltransferase
VNARKKEKIMNTEQLVSIIHSIIPKFPGKNDPATKSFQALRIAVNGEVHIFCSLLKSQQIFPYSWNN